MGEQNQSEPVWSSVHPGCYRIHGGYSAPGLAPSPGHAISNVRCWTQPPALGEAVRPRDLQSALRAYTSNAGYLRALLAGACRIDLDGKPAGAVTPEDEAVAKARLAEFSIGTSPRAKMPPAKGPEAPARASSAGVGPQASAMRPAEENQKPSAPKRLSLADLREAGRRRREAAA